MGSNIQDTGNTTNRTKPLSVSIARGWPVAKGVTIVEKLKEQQHESLHLHQNYQSFSSSSSTAGPRGTIPTFTTGDCGGGRWERQVIEGPKRSGMKVERDPHRGWCLHDNGKISYHLDRDSAVRLMNEIAHRRATSGRTLYVDPVTGDKRDRYYVERLCGEWYVLDRKEQRFGYSIEVAKCKSYWAARTKAREMNAECLSEKEQAVDETINTLDASANRSHHLLGSFERKAKENVQRKEL